jgi:iron complex transport system substrate-binding protein
MTVKPGCHSAVVGRRRCSLPIAALLLTVLLSTPSRANNATRDPKREWVDAARRHVFVPSVVKRVFAAGPPASVTLYTLAPDLLVGWSMHLSDEQRAFIPARYAALPFHGRLAGRGDTANAETVLSLKPDLIVDVGSIDATHISAADRIQEQTGIPVVIVDGALDHTAEAYRLLGDLLGVRERADTLAQYAEQTLAFVDRQLALIPRERRPRVYSARGADGLETGLGGSINVEVLERVGAVNVAAESGRGGLTRVSPAQLIAWDPDVIITLDPGFPAWVTEHEPWPSLRAVRQGRVLVAPSAPFGWYDSPPAANRLIGLRWLSSVLFPGGRLAELRTSTREFYALFYRVHLTEAQLDAFLRSSGSAIPGNPP